MPHQPLNPYTQKYIVDKELLKNDWFDLDEEVYESLATNFMYPYDIRDINGLNYILSKNLLLEKPFHYRKKIMVCMSLIEIGLMKIIN